MAGLCKKHPKVIFAGTFKQSLHYVVTFVESRATAMAKVKNVLNLLVVSLLLIGFPAVSYYYLSSGYAYRKDAILMQGDFGKMPDLSGYPAVRGVHPATSQGAMTLVGWLDPSEPEAARQYGTMLDSLYQQFENSPNLYFTTIVKADDAAVTAEQFAEQYHLPDEKMLNFLEADDAAFAGLARQFQLPAAQPGDAPIVALVDSSLTIVKHYDLAKRHETIGLVQLISLIIPLPEKPDLILKRGKEL